MGDVPVAAFTRCWDCNSMLSLRPQGLEGFDGALDEEATALGADDVAHDLGTVVPARQAPFGGQVAQCVAGKLHDEGLLPGAAGLHPQAVVNVEFEGVRGHCYVAQTQGVDLGRAKGLLVLNRVAGDDIPVHPPPGVVGRVRARPAP